MNGRWATGCLAFAMFYMAIASLQERSAGQSPALSDNSQSRSAIAGVEDSRGTSAIPATRTASKADKRSFTLRRDVDGLITDKRSSDEDKLRTQVLACAQIRDELANWRALLNMRWNRNSALTFGEALMDDWDKTYGPSIQRPEALLALLVYVAAHEKPRGFMDGDRLLVTLPEQKRVLQGHETTGGVLERYYKTILDKDSKWPNDVRAELQYNATSALENYGSPEIVTERIWEGMTKDKKFRSDMLGVMSNLANQATLERLVKFRDSQQWAEDDLDRIDQGIKDVKWWLERAEIMAKTRSPEAEARVIVSEEETKLMLKRVADAKAGRCPKISAVGSLSSRASLDALSLLYTKINVPVAVLASDTGDVGGIGAMVSGRAELMFLDGKPSDVAMNRHGEKWNALGLDETGKPSGAGPAEYVIAGRAVALIVNPANKLESLALGQVQAIFQGDVGDWAVIGDTELTAPAGPDGKPGKLGINLFGLRAGGGDARSSAAASVFHKEGVPANRLKRMTIQKDTAEAVAAVSMDPLAIAFVDLTAIPTTGQNVKVLPIKMGTGEKAKIVQPTPENIKNATYPLSQRLFLYVHPKASDTAKDFAKFIATCGGSEASPYADTVKAVMETYQKHGLIPIADAAIERAANDALAEAKARKTAKGKRK